MSVLIKGMKMPESCHVCVAGYGGLCFNSPPEEDAICPDHGRPDWCLLIELPPHGRLIDADVLHEELYALEYDRENEWFDGVREARGVDAARVALLDAPTILEAEEGE